MTLETHIDQAQTRVSEERTHVAGKRRAFEAFGRRVREIPTTGADASPGAGGGAGELFTAAQTTTTTGTSSAGGSCQDVCEAFAETVHPYSATDIDADGLAETMRSELDDDLAVALAPNTGGQLAATTKQAVLTKVTERGKELAVMRSALEIEEESLQSAAATTERVTDWLVEANETPLTELGFEALRARHETLAAHRQRCDELARDRQAVLDRTTSNEGAAGINHRTLVSFLYEEFPVEYPVLATVARLDEVCADCQRVVRDHLVRRV